MMNNWGGSNGIKVRRRYEYHSDVLREEKTQERTDPGLKLEGKKQAGCLQWGLLQCRNRLKRKSGSVGEKGLTEVGKKGAPLNKKNLWGPEEKGKKKITVSGEGKGRVSRLAAFGEADSNNTTRRVRKTEPQSSIPPSKATFSNRPLQKNVYCGERKKNSEWKKQNGLLKCPTEPKDVGKIEGTTEWTSSRRERSCEGKGRGRTVSTGKQSSIAAPEKNSKTRNVT